jgi:hypothetical protein
MERISQILKSRTFWTVVLLVGINTVPQLQGLIPDQLINVINVALGTVATYFHINPSQTYGQSGEV